MKIKCHSHVDIMNIPPPHLFWPREELERIIELRRKHKDYLEAFYEEKCVKDGGKLAYWENSPYKLNFSKRISDEIKLSCYEDRLINDIR